MNRAITTAKITGGIFRRAVSYNFCIGWAPLDPRKHTTMSHNTNNYYLDLWEYGNYPDWVHISSVPARTYEPQVVNTIVATLNSRYVPTPTPRIPASHLSSSSHIPQDLGLNSSQKISKSTPSFMKFTQSFWVNSQPASS